GQAGGAGVDGGGVAQNDSHGGGFLSGWRGGAPLCGAPLGRSDRRETGGGGGVHVVLTGHGVQRGEGAGGGGGPVAGGAVGGVGIGRAVVVDAGGVVEVDGGGGVVGHGG